MHAHGGETACGTQVFPDSFAFDSLGCAAAPWLVHDTASADAGRTVGKRQKGLMSWSFVAHLRPSVARWQLEAVAESRASDGSSGDARVKAAHSMSFARPLEQSDNDPNERAEILRQILTPLVIVAGLIALWLATAPLSRVVGASGQVKVAVNQRTTQHQGGGMPREILVRDEGSVPARQSLVAVRNARRDTEPRLLQEQFRVAPSQMASTSPAWQALPTLLR